MTDKKRSRIVSTGALAAMLLAALLILPSSQSQAADVFVKWLQRSVVKTIASGESVAVPILLGATANLSNVTVSVSPELQPYVQLTPPSFASMQYGQMVGLTLTVSAPITAGPANVQGTIQVLANGSPITGSLPVNVTVVSSQPTGGHYDPGTNVIINTRNLDAYGGDFQIQGTGTLLDGVTVSVPAGALDRPTTFSVGYNTGRLSVVSGTPSGVTLFIDAGTVKNFGQPVTITVPFGGDSTVVPVPYYLDPTGALKLAQLVNIDRSAHTFTFQTFHASWYTWITTSSLLSSTLFFTGYSPLQDGFQVVNRGSVYNRGGECLGMTSFSLWFYEDRQLSLGDFYSKYYNVIGTDSAGTSLRGQNIIATRAFISVTQRWFDSYMPVVAAQQQLSDGEKVASIKNALQNTGNPVLLYLYGNPVGAHSVLAYGFDSSILGATLNIYDPNHPGDTGKVVSYTPVIGFSSYCTAPALCFPGIVYSGDGSFNLTEPYQHILNDAEQNFQGSVNSTIAVTSHTSGQQVQTRNITLSGTVSSSQVLVTKLTVYVGSTSFSGTVGSNRAFSIPMQLDEGTNHIQFKTEGNDSTGNLIEVTNSLQTTDFTLIANVPHAMVLMTLTWDTNDTDLDTYVIDPTGDYSAYYHRVTQDGGTLDRDVITGFGPEHWTLLSTNVVRYGQPYRFRVHYYSDHGNGPSNYTVTIKLYEGTPQEVTYSYRGNLAVSDPDNDAPNGQGPDWADIASIILVQAGAQNVSPLVSLSAGAQGAAIGQEEISITVPVPPVGQRLKR